MRRLLAPVLLLALALAGCAAPEVQTASAPAPAAPAATSVLAGAVEPEALEAMAFDLVGSVGQGGPAYGAGEPSIIAGLDGTLFLSFPGCDRDTGPGFILPVESSCPIGPVHRSEDGGKTWKRLNGDDGKLAADGKGANGDADVAVDAAGAVYTSNLGDGIEAQASYDGGDTWVNLGNVVPEDSRAVDRNWLAAGAPGHVIHNWMGGPQNDGRLVGAVATFDGGKTWTNVSYFGKSIGWQGSVQMDPNNDSIAYIPFTEPTGAASDPARAFIGIGEEFELQVGRTLDGGRTWEVLRTGTMVHSAITGMHFSGLLMAPALGVTGDGTVVYAYSEEQPDPAGATNAGSVVKLIASKDGGQTWSKPVVLSETPNAIMPWVAPGAGDRVAITYFSSEIPGDPDRVGLWDLAVTVVDGVGSEAPKKASTVIEQGVHEGGICTRGGLCTFTGSDRALLDYFESTVLPDGRLAIVYPADPVAGGKYIEIRVAIQNGGTPLLARP